MSEDSEASDWQFKDISGRLLGWDVATNRTPVGNDWQFRDPAGRLPALKEAHYGLILADPPWKTNLRSPKGYRKSPEAHYRTMTLAELIALDVRRLAARDCMLVMWCTWPHLQTGMTLMREWGFTYKTGGAWLKRTRYGKLSMGPGYILRSSCEPYLIGSIGKPAIRVKRRNIRNVIETEEDVITDDLTEIDQHIDGLRRKHSVKPPEMRNMLDRMRPEPGAELFARTLWPGRDVWGDEVDHGDGAQPAAITDLTSGRPAVCEV